MKVQPAHEFNRYPVHPHGAVTNSWPLVQANCIYRNYNHRCQELDVVYGATAALNMKEASDQCILPDRVRRYPSADNAMSTLLNSIHLQHVVEAGHLSSPSQAKRSPHSENRSHQDFSVAGDHESATSFREVTKNPTLPNYDNFATPVQSAHTSMSLQASIPIQSEIRNHQGPSVVDGHGSTKQIEQEMTNVPDLSKVIEECWLKMNALRSEINELQKGVDAFVSNRRTQSIQLPLLPPAAQPLERNFLHKPSANFPSHELLSASQTPANLPVPDEGPRAQTQHTEIPLNQHQLQ